MDTLEVAAERQESQMMSPIDKLSQALVTGEGVDNLTVRDALLKIAALEAEKDELGKVIRDIAERYRVKGERLDSQIEQLRSSVETYLIRFTADGKVSYPDVGTAYLQKGKPKVEVVDDKAFEAWARERGYLVEKVDTTAAKKAVLETGEAAPGATILPAEKGLRIRSASS